MIQIWYKRIFVSENIWIIHSDLCYISQPRWQQCASVGSVVVGCPNWVVGCPNRPKSKLRRKPTGDDGLEAYQHNVHFSEWEIMQRGRVSLIINPPPTYIKLLEYSSSRCFSVIVLSCVIALACIIVLAIVIVLSRVMVLTCSVSTCYGVNQCYGVILRGGRIAYSSRWIRLEKKTVYVISWVEELPLPNFRTPK